MNCSRRSKDIIHGVGMGINSRNDTVDQRRTTVTAELPTVDGHRLAYTLETMLAPFDFNWDWRFTDTVSALVPLRVLGAEGAAVELDPNHLRCAFERISGLAEDSYPRDELDRMREDRLASNAFGPDLSEWGLDIGRKLGLTSQRQFTVHLTHDVDRVHPLDPMGLLRRLLVPTRGIADTLSARGADFLGWIKNSSGFGAVIERIMAAEQDAGARATYFCMSGPYSFRKIGARTGDCRRSRRMAEIIHLAKRYGHRIGLHGCAYSLEQADYSRQRQALSQTTGHVIDWHRNHYLVWNHHKSPGMLDKSGFRVDSTVGFNSLQAFRAGLAWPYRLWDHVADRASDIIELPMVFMDAAGVIIERPGPAWDDLYAQMESAAAVSGEVAVNFHPEYFLGQPHVFEGYVAFVRWLRERGAVLDAEL